jgi:hypothetical protein
VQRIQLRADGDAGTMLGDERIEPREDSALMGTWTDDGEARAGFQHGNQGIEQGQRARAALTLPLPRGLGDTLRTGHVPQGANTSASTDAVDSVDHASLEVCCGFVSMTAKHVRRFRRRPVSAQRSRRRSMSIDNENFDRTRRCSELGHSAR